MNPARAILFACHLLLGIAAPADEARIATAERHVAALTFSPKPIPAPGSFADEIEAALKGRDAETSTTSYLYAISRNSGGLLSDEQSRQWTELLASRQESVRRLHDERNVLRGFFFTKAWQLPLASGPEETKARTQLHAWLEVWINLTLQERIAHHQLCRDAWRILTDSQRARLQAGEWDRFVRKSTGHERAYFGDRIVRRALGEPDHPEAFRSASTKLASEHEPIRRQLQEAERRWRILTFHIPAVPDVLLAAEWHQTAAALKAYFLTQVQQLETLVSAGYDLKTVTGQKRVLGQVARTRDELADKVASKLTAGQAFHRNLLSAE